MVFARMRLIDRKAEWSRDGALALSTSIEVNPIKDTEGK
jgi:hypothetical protein